MSTAAPRPALHNEIVLHVKVSPATLSEVVQRLVGIFTSVPVTVQADTADSPPAEDDPAAMVESTADPPRLSPLELTPPVHSMEVPAADPPDLPPDLARKYVLGSLCRRGHTYNELPWSLRKKSNRGCAACDVLSSPRVAPPPTPRPVERPPLPPHLAGSCFLSPIRCAVEAHHWRDTAYTLRYREDEVCVQCVTKTSSLALAGD